MPWVLDNIPVQCELSKNSKTIPEFKESTLMGLKNRYQTIEKNMKSLTALGGQRRNSG